MTSRDRPRDLRELAEHRGQTADEAESLAAAPGFAAKFEACRRLRDAAWDARPRLGTRDTSEAVIRTTFARSLRTFNAVLRLCDAGFGDQAVMLCRSLFEDMVVSYWLAENPQEAHRLDRHHLHQLVLYQEAVAKHGLIANTPVVESLSDEQRAKLASEFRRGLWTGENVYEMLKSIEHRWDEHERAQLWQMHDIAYRFLNLLLHHSFSGLASSTYEADDRRFILSARPSPQNVDQALDSAFYSFSQLARLVADRERLAKVDAVIEAERPCMRDLDPDELRGASRNDPCPCGSGRKFKHCHGA